MFKTYSMIFNCQKFILHQVKKTVFLAYLLFTNMSHILIYMNCYYLNDKNSFQLVNKSSFTKQWKNDKTTIEEFCKTFISDGSITSKFHYVTPPIHGPGNSDVTIRSFVNLCKDKNVFPTIVVNVFM